MGLIAKDLKTIPKSEIITQDTGILCHYFALVLQEMCESVSSPHVPIRTDMQRLYDGSDPQVRCHSGCTKRYLANMPLQSLEFRRI